MVLALVQHEISQGDDVGVPTTSAADDLAGYVRRELEGMQQFRTMIGLEQRLLKCARMREGQYEPADLAEIQAVTGSEVYIRLVSNKIRASYAVLSGIFLQGERPWDIGPTPDPVLPDNIAPAIQQTVAAEIANLKANGVPVQPAQIRQRVGQLMAAADLAAKKKARVDAVVATTKLDDICTEGGMYEALSDFLLDFATYPVAILRGPTVVMKTDVHYVEGKPKRERRPMLTFERVSPHDLLWTSGAAGSRTLGFVNGVGCTVPTFKPSEACRVLTTTRLSPYFEITARGATLTLSSRLLAVAISSKTSRPDLDRHDRRDRLHRPDDRADAGRVRGQ